MIEDWVRGHGWTFETAPDGTVVVPFAVPQPDGGSASVHLLARAGDRHVALAIRPAERVTRPQWTVALWLVNAWNGRSPVMKARLDVADPVADPDAPIVLEGWWPLAAGTGGEQVGDVLDQMLRDGLAFWTPVATEPAGEPAEEQARS